jgi:hypothetical protein
MVCSDCQSKGRWSNRPVTRRDRSLDRLRTLSCASCGRLLPTPDSTERLLGMLSGLSRFGLAPEGRPVLIRARSA